MLALSLTPIRKHLHTHTHIPTQKRALAHTHIILIKTHQIHKLSYICTPLINNITTYTPTLIFAGKCIVKRTMKPVRTVTLFSTQKMNENSLGEIKNSF